MKHPRHYRWSSYRANAEGKQLACDEEKRRDTYRALFAAHLDPHCIEKIRSATNGNYALGNDRFVAEIEQALKRRAAPGKGDRPGKEVGVS